MVTRRWEQEKQGKARFVTVSRAPGAKTYIGHGDPVKRTEAEREREGEGREGGGGGEIQDYYNLNTS